MRRIGFLLMAALLFSCGAKQETQTGKRYVVLSPELSHIIVALGAESGIVGCTEECKLQGKARVGNFGALNREAILKLKPDIVFSSALEQSAITQELQKLGLRVEQFYPQSLNEMLLTIRQVGTVIDKRQRAEELCDSLSQAIQQLKKENQGKRKPRVYIEIYRDPLMSVSDASFVGELIETAGGDNIFSSLERDYARVDAEDVIKAKPQIMICYSQDTLQSILSRKGWQDIPAIRDQRVYFERDIDPDLIQQASPRCIEGLRRFSELYEQWRTGE